MKDSCANVLRFCSADPGRKLFGIELEIEVISEHHTETVEFIEDKFHEDVIVKHDASLGGARRASWFNGSEVLTERKRYMGAEIVTRPMTYLHQLNFWRKFNKVISEYKWRESMISHNGRRCGLHIHTAKAGIDTESAIRLMLFVNNRTHEPLLTKLCQRYNSQWARIYTINPATTYVPSLDRYSLIAPRSETYEWRMFRGSLVHNRILSYLQFSKTLIDFVKDTERADLTEANYISFVKGKQYYKELKSYLEI